MSLMLKWSQPLIEHEAFRAFSRARIGLVLDWEDGSPSFSNAPVKGVELPGPLDQQHEAVLQFFTLWQRSERLKMMEFYFRRYPFTGLPFNRHEHLENICNMYFGQFYFFEERMCLYLNALNAVASGKKVDVGATRKQFKKLFRQELSARHDTTHNLEPFDDISLNAVLLNGLWAQNGLDHKEAIRTYRKAASIWAKRARLGSRQVLGFLEGISEATLIVAPFLNEPIDLQSYAPKMIR